MDTDATLLGSLTRTDREIVDPARMREIIDASDVVRVGVVDGAYPYIVPLSFGWTWTGTWPSLYVHGAPKGRKASLFACSPQVCVEFDRFFRYDQTKRGITARYESLIGMGYVVELETPEDKTFALRQLCIHCGYTYFEPADCGTLTHTKAWRIDTEELTGKQNLRSLEV